MKVLVVGFGPRGQAHAAALKELGHDIAIVTRARPNPTENAAHLKAVSQRAREIMGASVPVFSTLSGRDAPELSRWDQTSRSFKPEFAAILATPAASHYDEADFLLNRRIPLLVERPMSLDTGKDTLLALYSQTNHTSLVAGYADRFNPAVIHFINEYLPLMGDIKVITCMHTYPSGNPNHSLQFLGAPEMDLILRILGRDHLTTSEYGSIRATWQQVNGLIEHAEVEMNLNRVRVDMTFAAHRTPTRVIYIQDKVGEIKIDLNKQQILEPQHGRGTVVFDGKGVDLIAEELSFFLTAAQTGLTAQNPGPYDPWLFNIGSDALMPMQVATTRAKFPG